MNHRVLALCALASLGLGCAPSMPPPPGGTQPGQSGAMPAADSLGKDVLLIAIPSDDDTLIGKVFIPRTAETGTEVDFQANPCLEHLNIKTFNAHRRVADVQKFDAGVNASAMLKAINIGAHATNVTDYQYEFDISRKMVADDTVAYGECCAKARGGCGDNFVREMYYGTGRYRLLRNQSAGGGFNVPVIAGAGGHVNYYNLGEQSFQGFFAYKTKTTPTAQPKPSEDRTVVVPDGDPNIVMPKVLEGAAAIEQDGPAVLITTKSADNFRDDQIKAIGSARKKQRRALKNLLAGPPYSTPPEKLNDRVEAVYKGGKEEDAYRDDKGDWFLKMRYRM